MNAAAPTNDGNTNGSGANSLHDAGERNVGADQQPRQPGAEHAGRDADDDRQLDRSPQRPDRLAEGVAEIGVERDGPPQHVHDRCDEDDGDAQCARPRNGSGRADQPSRPASRIIARVDCRSPPSLSSSMSADPPSSISGRIAAGSTPAAERVLERLIREVSLRLLLQQEADQLDRLVLRCRCSSSIEAPVTITRLPMSSTGEVVVDAGELGILRRALGTRSSG